MENPNSNADPATVRAFGYEWSRFDQADIPQSELQRYFDAYFSIFPWERLPPNAAGADIGCGSGRWAAFVAPRVGALHCVDASSEALAVAKRRLASEANCTFTEASVSDMGIPASSLDFAYSLGVLHHVPDTFEAIRKCVQVLRPGAPFLVYLYYALDGRSFAYRLLWFASAVVRRLVSRLPLRLKGLVTDLIAITVYWPLSRLCGVLEALGLPVSRLPLAYYRYSSLQTLRTDSLDRFGTPLERRFTREEISRMLSEAGLVDIRFSEMPPFWCAVGFRK